MKAIFLTLLSILAFSTFAQDKAKPSIKPTLSGQLAVSTNGKDIFANMGGPGLKLEITPKIAVSANMFPSLRYQKSTDDADIKPFLGAGFQVYFKKFIVLMPVYYVPTSKQWTVTGGIGWKFK